jgi:light-regulated signal transduction histidine kinase (bacteriophytochrome)
VTEIKAAQARIEALVSQLEASNRAAAEANRELEAFSYSVSHDLRAPLRHAHGFVDLLTKHAGAALDDQGRRYLKVISDAASRMGRLIDDLLSFSRTGRAELRPAAVSMTRLLEEARGDLKAEEAGRKVTWVVQPLPDAHGDPALLRQVWTNLLSNALKYTRNRPEARIEVGAVLAGGGGAAYYVRDNGAGFDMAYAGKLFGVFQRLHSAQEFEGTGIGLANVKRIIGRHGGEIWAEGQVDHGATFYFTIPRPGENGS